MNEWCESHLTKELKEKVYIAAIKKGYNPDDYFNAIFERTFDFSNHYSDGRLDPDVDVVTNEVIAEFDSQEEE